MHVNASFSSFSSLTQIERCSSNAVCRDILYAFKSLAVYVVMPRPLRSVRFLVKMS